MLTDKQIVNRLNWIDALRSGMYTQGRGKLRITDVDINGNETVKHCCLGVAQDVIGIESASGNDDNSEYLGLADCENKLGIQFSAQTWLSRLNDEYRLSFNEIADQIEKLTDVDLESENSV